MHPSWLELCCELEIAPSEDETVSLAELAWPQLERAYATPLRAYHSLQHVEQTLFALDELMPRGQTRWLAELALWFHDAIYIAGRTDNESLSAAMCQQVTQSWPLSASQRSCVHDAILATRHIGVPTDEVGQFVVDADLAILAADAATYTNYVAAIRQEFAAFDDVAFSRGRETFLRAMLRRERLFHTPRAFTIWETRARENLAAELTRLIAKP